MATDHDRFFMDIAARSALRAIGRVEPNPMVGCVLSREGRILAVGHHRVHGELHAERDAIASCRAAGHDPRGSTAHVTLEPCNGVGNQPPCVEALIEAGITRVVYAVRDPNPAKAGGGDRLRSHGVIVDQLGGHPLAHRLSAPFRQLLSDELPWVTAKWAQTIDGRIATRDGESKWISSPAARRRVHRFRSRIDAVLTGVGTVLADNPMLTARAEDGARRVRRRACRVVIDSRLSTPLSSALVESAGTYRTIIVTTPGDEAWARRRESLTRAGIDVLDVPPNPDGKADLRQALAALARQRELSTILVEAGPRLLGGLLLASLVNEAIVHLAPMILADEHARPCATGREAPLLSGASRWRLDRVKRIGPDVELWYSRDDRHGRQ
ncbi:MAG: bifunctional diaminohydroxyphosphoribosylaminopyrimidine deaminase/5-amino-6-(5-phosphoribosylamino)uracil reductase RibD [Phycisphaeraceae bacterium]|nr:bifunctional diaminohydroxyphosphoribosylaminopyrimidine deaminase/5-amino-6-(5-phosphoribosylamino)uracil reductase RibD [Phycisphaerae bacterium]MBX3391576.1 bifunctional diaminohydroxyphosphoribosylaminopyrimidine deaminase/5-amino-6-(5-phosphoribosylamino)uracil reductase RibD [Phycisphaeraceae bacterium]